MKVLVSPMPKLKMLIFMFFCATSLVANGMRFTDSNREKQNGVFSITDAILGRPVRLESLEGYLAAALAGSNGSGIGVNGRWFVLSQTSAPSADFPAPATGSLAAGAANRSPSGPTSASIDSSGKTRSDSALGTGDLRQIFAQESAGAGVVGEGEGAGSGDGGEDTPPGDAPSAAAGDPASDGAAKSKQPGTSLFALSPEEDGLLTIASTPEPSPLAMAGAGLVAFALIRRKR